ncbi:MAG: hypothetical protein LC800_17780 [Acidobacteria bacterium]|nr:hypothetical protein [Acidobacteriota bacterium]
MALTRSSAAARDGAETCAPECAPRCRDSRSAPRCCAASSESGDCARPPLTTSSSELKRGCTATLPPRLTGTTSSSESPTRRTFTPRGAPAPIDQR